MARAMGIIPSSEKVAPQKKKARVELPIDDEIARLLKTERQLKELGRYISRKLKSVQRNIAVGIQKRDTESIAESANEPSTELVLAGGADRDQGCEENNLNVDDEARVNMGSRRIETKTRRKKTDLLFDHRTKVINGEKIYDPDTGRTLAMDLSLVGPKGKQITWRALANIVVLVFGMAMPASRIEKLFGKKGFSRSNISDHCGYIAARLLPIYIAMSEAIAKCPVIMGDDCVSRISNLTRYRRDLNTWKKAKKLTSDEAVFLEENPEPKPPWEGLSPESLTVQLEAELDFCFVHNKAQGNKEQKTRLHTSLLSGETTCGDPQSRIVLYRSHLGSVGNLLSRVLLSRKSSDGPLVFVGDLSSSNHVTDPDVLKRVSISYAGCASHARRPFKRHFDHDPEECEVALDLIRSVFHLEEISKGASDKLKLEIRSENSMWSWNELKAHCLELQEKWSPSTALGEGIEYVISNFEQLTLYCRDVRLPVSNDLSERLLRYEKLMDRSSFGRETIEGRARYDIIRSFWQTCVSAGIDPTFALIDILITPHEKVLEKPELYIPQQIAERHKADAKHVELIDKILHSRDLSSLVSYKLYDPNMPVDDEDENTATC